MTTLQSLQHPPAHMGTPLGATLCAGGVLFGLAAPNAKAVDLCIFDESGLQETERWALPVCRNGIWQGWLPGAGEGLVYGWRVHGPWCPGLGHRFNPAKLLLDPFAEEVLGAYGGQDIHQSHQSGAPDQPDGRDNASVAFKAKVVAPLAKSLVPRPVISAAERVILELHVKNYTALHPDLPPVLRGTYAGLCHPKVVAHLKQLGVTTLCLMPVALRADEARLLQGGLRNHWGYNPVAWNAPESRYWSGTTPSARQEFLHMVEALHLAGFEVILDVVYNHTAESDEAGPTLGFRGIDNSLYYHLDQHNPARYHNWSGCGNSVNLGQPLVLRTAMDSLRHWANTYGVDGFRFDLAPILGRCGVDGQFSTQAPLLQAMGQDPQLRDLLMVAEPWDVGAGGYQIGAFPSGWLEWNDHYRDTVRRYWLTGGQALGDVATRLAGSSDRFGHHHRGAHSSVNFVTAHDGYTLQDLVSYNDRHNTANGENNRDGHSHNWSHNHGTEGPSPDDTITTRRRHSAQALITTLIVSAGTPMLLGGDEIGHTQGGNNNAYCQDNETTWLNWAEADIHRMRFVSDVLRWRKHCQPVYAHGWWATPPGDGHCTTAQWLDRNGVAMDATAWADPMERFLQLLLTPPSGPAVLCLFNAAPTAVMCTLPQGSWWLQLDSTCGSVCDQPLDSRSEVPPRCVWLAICKADET